MRTWQVERRKRTRHLIELGGLVVKAGLVELTGDDRVTILGALLWMADKLQSDRGEHARELWAAKGRQAFEAEARHCQRRKMTLALTPPKPNPFEMACSMGMCLASWATMSMPWAAVSLLSRLRVGGATWSRKARIVKIASAPPAAPSR
jgi:Conjugal transfer protein TraD